MLGISKRVAKLLLETGCVSLRPKDPFTYASGLKGPIYCDNRKVLSYPKQRSEIVNCFLEFIKDEKLEFDAVAGLATGGIPHSSFIAHEMDCPMLYVRSKPKGHGKQSLVEGDASKVKKVLLIEDLINQGSSLDKVIEPIRSEGLELTGVLSVVSYEMQTAKEVSDKNQLSFHSLTNFSSLVEVGMELKLIDGEQSELLMQWQKNPAEWSAQHS